MRITTCICSSYYGMLLIYVYTQVWRNCAEDYAAPLTIWLPRAPEGYVTVGCVAVAAYEEPLLTDAYCVSERIAEEAQFEEQIMWMAPDSYPWSHTFPSWDEALTLDSDLDSFEKPPPRHRHVLLLLQTPPR
ncbi:hypothetical protein B296_00057737 [Ensete ventricosum]|uniref:Uncharacterized protein n=1 Tax=Ensete ventricosum TaxID=4639 RepID=A0A426XPZ2_ENSVE|nr:hypothetical protein B296_00057737 [Ensete ventricosum]